MFNLRCLFNRGDHNNLNGGVLYSCFVEEDLDRDGALKHDEVADLVSSRFTLYGPAVNATANETLVYHFENLVRVVMNSTGLIVTGRQVYEQSTLTGILPLS